MDHMEEEFGFDEDDDQQTVLERWDSEQVEDIWMMKLQLINLEMESTTSTSHFSFYITACLRNLQPNLIMLPGMKRLTNFWLTARSWQVNHGPNTQPWFFLLCKAASVSHGKPVTSSLGTSSQYTGNQRTFAVTKFSKLSWRFNRLSSMKWSRMEDLNKI